MASTLALVLALTYSAELRAESVPVTSRTSLQLVVGTTATVASGGLSYLMLAHSQDGEGLLVGLFLGLATPLITGTLVCEVGNARSQHPSRCDAPVAAAYGTFMVGLVGLALADSHTIDWVDKHKPLLLVALATVPTFAATVAWNIAQGRRQSGLGEVMLSTPLISF